MSDIILIDAPDNDCFGCSPFNERGLRLAWRRTDEGEIEATYTADRTLNGAPGVVHGGIQAVLLDETMGVAINYALGDEPAQFVVTAHFELDYRRPVPTDVPVLLTARRTRVEGRNHFVEGEIRDLQRAVLTRATARWVEVPPPEGSSRFRAAPRG